MDENVAIGTPRPIRSCGHDEYWLQDQIADNPSVLQLGDELEVLYRERRQSAGGRLDCYLETRPMIRCMKSKLCLGIQTKPTLSAL
jgi:hypothetical protein